MNLKQMLRKSEIDNCQVDWLERVFLFLLEITKSKISNTEYFLWISLYVQHFTWIISFDLHNFSVMWILKVLFYR